MPLLSEIVVRFAGDVTGLNAAASTASNLINNFRGGVGPADEESMTFFGHLKENWKTFNEGSSRVSEFVNHLTEMKFGWMATIQSMISADAEMEQTKIAFTTLLHSGTQADAFIKQLWNFAAQTPFQFQNLAQSAQQMLAFGYSAKDIVPDLTHMGDALSAMGRTDAGSLQQIVTVFGQMRAAGKINSQDMMQLTTLGIPGWQMLADAMHLTVAQVRQLSQSGKLASDEAIPMLFKGLDKTFGGSMQNQAHTFNGLLTTVKDNLIAAWRAVSGPLFDAAKGALEAFGKLVASDAFQNFAKTVADGIGGAFKVVGQAVLWVMSGLSPLGSLFAAIGKTAVPIFKNIGDTLTQVGSIIKGVFTGMGGGGENPLTKTFAGLVTTALPAVKSFGEQAMAVIYRIQAILSTVNIQPFVAAIRQAGSVVGPVFQQIGQFITNSLVPALLKFGPVLLECGRIFMTTLLPALKQTAQMIMGEAQTAFKVLGPLIQQLGAWFVGTLLPAIRQVMPIFAQLAATVMAQIIPTFTQMRIIIMNISMNVLPPLWAALEFIIPIVISLAGFIAQGLTVAFNILGPAVRGVLSAITTVADFFSKNEVAADALKAVLITLGTIIAVLVVPALIMMAVDGIIAVVTAIPGIVLGFGAWAVSAGLAALATLALIWPILLIVAVIALVVLGIILAVQHWGQIVAWLKGVWGSISSWFAGLWNSIKSIFTSSVSAVSSFFVSVWTTIVNFFKGVWNGIVAFLHAAWGIIVNVVKIGAIALLVAATWPIIAIVALFLWLYNHNYYFKALIDAIVNFVKAGLAWLQSAWSNTISFISGLWNGIVNTATDIWNTVTSAIQTAVNTVIDWVKSMWNNEVNGLKIIWGWLSGFATNAWNAVRDAVMGVVNPVISWLKGLWDDEVRGLGIIWDTLSGLAQTAWNNVVSVFQSVWGSISGALSGLWTNISNWFSDLAGQAIQWGQGIINGIINGIGNMLGALGDAASNAAQTVWKFLGFHSSEIGPTKEGPGARLGEWGPGIINGLANGMLQRLPQLHSALGVVAGAIASTPLGGMSLGRMAMASSGGLPRGTSSGAGQPVIHNHIYVDGRELSGHLASRIVSMVRSEGPVGRIA